MSGAASGLCPSVPTASSLCQALEDNDLRAIVREVASGHPQPGHVRPWKCCLSPNEHRLQPLGCHEGASTAVNCAAKSQLFSQGGVRGGGRTVEKVRSQQGLQNLQLKRQALLPVLSHDNLQNSSPRNDRNVRTYLDPKGNCVYGSTCDF